MNYWKIVDGGDFKTYGKKFFEYYLNNQNKFRTYSNPYWNELNPSCIGEVLTLIPEMKEGLQKFGTIRDIALMILWDDKLQALNSGVVCRLNIPIANCDDSRIAFYELTEEEYKKHTVSPSGTKKWSMEYKEKLQPVANICVTEPTILNIPEPHTVFCDTKQYPRVAISIAFVEDLTHHLKI